MRTQTEVWKTEFAITQNNLVVLCFELLESSDLHKSRTLRQKAKILCSSRNNKEVVITRRSVYRSQVRFAVRELLVLTNWLYMRNIPLKVCARVPCSWAFVVTGFVTAGFVIAEFVIAEFVTAGFVTAGFVNAGFVTAGFLTAGFVTAGFVNAGFVTAGFVTAGFVTAGFVTAGFVIAGFVIAGFVIAGLVIAELVNTVLLHACAYLVNIVSWIGTSYNGIKHGVLSQRPDACNRAGKWWCHTGAQTWFEHQTRWLYSTDFTTPWTWHDQIKSNKINLVFEFALSFSSGSWILGPPLVRLRLIRAQSESLKRTWTG